MANHVVLGQSNSVPPLIPNNETIEPPSKSTQVAVNIIGKEKKISFTEDNLDFFSPPSNLVSSIENEMTTDAQNKVINPSEKRRSQKSLIKIPSEHSIVHENLINPELAEVLQKNAKKIDQTYKKLAALYKEVLQKKTIEIGSLEAEEIKNATKDLITKANIFLMDAQIPSFQIDEKETKKGKFLLGTKEEKLIPFPDLFLIDDDLTMQAALENIEKYLKQDFFLDLSMSLKKGKNKDILVGIVQGARKIFEKNSKLDELKDSVAFFKTQLDLLNLYRSDILILLDALNALLKVSSSGYLEIAQNAPILLQPIIKKITDTAPKGAPIFRDKYFKKITHAIRIYYLEHYLDKGILKMINEQLNRLEERISFQNDPLVVSHFCHVLEPKIEASFSKIPSDSTLWQDYLINGTLLLLVKKNGKEKIAIDPFEKTENEEASQTEERLQLYISKWFNIVGLGVFKDKTIMNNFSLFLNNEASMNKENVAAIQENAFSVLTAMVQDPMKLKKFLSPIDEKLIELHWQTVKSDKVSSQIIMDYMMKIYRCPSDKIAWVMLDILFNTCKEIYSEDERLIESLKDLLENENKKIEMVLVEASHIEFRFTKKGDLGCKECPCAYLLSYKIPMPGVPTFKNPISIQFYYKYPESPDFMNKEIKESIRKFALLLKAMGLQLLPIKSNAS